MDIKVIVATHKEFRMPEDNIYLPVHVGAKGKEEIAGYIRDDTGDNISEKNPAFCELTGLYWAWKNLDAEYIGLAHYRRHFKGKGRGKSPFDRILTGKEAEILLKKSDILVTKKRKYYIENIYDHYKHTLYVETLDKAGEILKEKYPEYSESFDKCMKHTYMHAFNMFIMKKEYLCEYCQWLFDILFRLEEELKDRNYSVFHSRYPGRISELLLDVWLMQKGYGYTEVPFIYMDNINYMKKGISFLKSKFFHKRYEESF